MKPAEAAVWTFESSSAERTEALARGLAERLRGGEVILLRGELGAGKTCFTAALAEALGSAERAISPTFVILRSYRVRDGLTLHHLDCYRLEGAEDLEGAGLEDCLDAEAIVVAEWPERCRGAFEAFTLDIRFNITADESRSIEIRRGELAFKAGDWPGSCSD